VEIAARVKAIVAVDVRLCASATAAVNNAANRIATIGEGPRLPVRASLPGNDSVVDPAAQDVSDDAGLRPVPRQLPNVIGYQALTDIKDRVASIKLRQGYVCGVTLAGACAVRTGRTAVPGRSTVNRVAPSVVQVEDHAVAGLFFQ